MDATGKSVRLKKPLEGRVRAGHPWVYREALAALAAEPGETVTVLGRDGRFVGRGYADGGPIAVRVVTTREEPFDADLVRRRLRAAADLRDRVVPEGTTGYRLLHGEGDRLPGVVVDVYGETAVLRLDGDGALRRLDAWSGPVADAVSARGARTLLHRRGRGEGRRVDVLRGEHPAAPIEIREHGMVLRADLVHGQKTGLFLDQRESRRRVRALARGLRVLDLYAYTGGFSAAAGLGGAVEVTTVDVAPAAIELARDTWARNGLPEQLLRAEAADVPAFLEEARRSMWELVIADPPSFAPRESAVEAALEAYAKLHAAALARIAPGGLYLAASCSSHVDRARFDDTLREGARRASRIVQLLDRWGPPPDHPSLLAFPEGDYLKVTLLRVF